MSTITFEHWLRLDKEMVSEIVSAKISTATIYLNGTRRWFLTQSQDWDQYAKITGAAQRRISQLFYDHGLKALLQPILGYDLLSRGEAYLKLAVDQGLGELASADFKEWMHREEIRVTFYGNWVDPLTWHGFESMVSTLKQVETETARYTRRQLLFGLFADEGLGRVLDLAKQAESGTGLLEQYYGQVVNGVDLIVGSGQPAIWDIPLLDINKASLYFLQAPTFCLDQLKLRSILYDHLFVRQNDDELYDDLTADVWENAHILGVGEQSRKGWMAVQ